MMDIAQILSRKFPDNEWTLNGDDYAGLVWLSTNPKPTEKKLQDLWSIVQQEIIDEKSIKATAKAALLERLGISAEEADLLVK
jgi:hypothetical protein